MVAIKSSVHLWWLIWVFSATPPQLSNPSDLPCSSLPVCVAKQPVWKLLGTGHWEELHKIFPLRIVTVHWTFISLKPYWVIWLGIRGAIIVYCYVIKWEVSYSPSIHATMPRIRSELDWGCQDVRNQGISVQGINLIPMEYRADSRFAPSQWEMSLQSNVISQWLGANLESALEYSIAHKGRFFTQSDSWFEIYDMTPDWILNGSFGFPASKHLQLQCWLY